MMNWQKVARRKNSFFFFCALSQKCANCVFWDSMSNCEKNHFFLYLGDMFLSDFMTPHNNLASLRINRAFSQSLLTTLSRWIDIWLSIMHFYLAQLSVIGKVSSLTMKRLIIARRMINLYSKSTLSSNVC